MHLTPADIQRFWSYVEKSDGCWLWRGTILDSGYGQFKVRGRKYRAHLVSCEIAGSPIPPELQGCHSCDVRACIRPDHIFPGTSAENAADMVQKGRARNQNTGKTHCVRGHPLTPENLLHREARNCRTCNTERAREWRQARKRHPANHEKTHCPKGHPYTPENTYSWASHPGRRCRQCREDRRLSAGHNAQTTV